MSRPHIITLSYCTPPSAMLWIIRRLTEYHGDVVASYSHITLLHSPFGNILNCAMRYAMSCFLPWPHNIILSYCDSSSCIVVFSVPLRNIMVNVAASYYHILLLHSLFGNVLDYSTRYCISWLMSRPHIIIFSYRTSPSGTFRIFYTVTEYHG